MVLIKSSDSSTYSIRVYDSETMQEIRGIKSIEISKLVVDGVITAKIEIAAKLDICAEEKLEMQ